MNGKASGISLLESRIIVLLNKLKDNHLNLKTLKERNALLEKDKMEMEVQVKSLKEENKSLKIANNLLGSNDGKTQTKAKINSLIKEVDYCISQLTEMN
jgi:cell shape-determining protein MreC